MLVKSSVAVALLTSFVAAQTFNSTIDPNTVTATLRSQWCQAQTNTCGTLCSGELNSNTCEPSTLTYDCTCLANSSAPGLEYYKETIPTFICEQIFQNCIKAGERDSAAQAVCTKNEQANCGQLSPENFTAAATTSASATTSPTGTASSAASGTAAASSSSSAAAATLMPLPGQTFSTGAIAVGVAAAFGYML